MSAVEKLSAAYHYYGMVNLTAGELFFWKSFSKGSIPVWLEIANTGRRTGAKFENQAG
ncbi:MULTISPECIES: hypothetical protein [Burkholderia]|uniref:Uncharacterized protein n=1 Tax=Burkholderia sola TaxID=2843302 RepID=A0ABV2CCL5_9BURK|nr:hypothetical protein [Burkholderia sp. CpTa8-5]MBP0608516.1 hypothetical protein [Burkholderia sp. CpTa8-5]